MTLSRLELGFESPWGRHFRQKLPRMSGFFVACHFGLFAARISDTAKHATAARTSASGTANASLKGSLKITSPTVIVRIGFKYWQNPKTVIGRFCTA